MRFTSLFTALCASFALVAAAPAAPPQFEVIFSGAFQLGEFQSAEGPLGTRIHAAINGANFTDPSGNLVATALPSADTGFVSASGIFFPEAVLPIVWEADGKYAYLQANGVGVLFESDLVYVHLETDSETWSGLNGRFLVGNVSFPEGQQSAPIFTLFGAV